MERIQYPMTMSVGSKSATAIRDGLLAGPFCHQRRCASFSARALAIHWGEVARLLCGSQRPRILCRARVTALLNSIFYPPLVYCPSNRIFVCVCLTLPFRQAHGLGVYPVWILVLAPDVLLNSFERRVHQFKDG